MARVFISVLGTTDYVECIYTQPDTSLKCPTRFVQEATVLMNCQNWSEKDRILVFTTQEAQRRNWLDDGQTIGQEKAPKIQQGLKSRLENLSLKPAIKNIMIPEGKTIEEIWDIFNLIFGELKKSDEVVFDITHSFRSIPMLVMVILNYAKVVRNVTLKGIYYGAMESLGNLSEVRNMPPADRIVPIFDLSAFDELLDWSVAIERFLESGDGSRVYALADRKARAIKTVKKGPDVAADLMNNIAACINTFSEEVSTCRGLELPRTTTRLRENVSRGVESCLEPAFVPLLEHLDQRLRTFSGKSVEDGLRAVEWCAEHNLVQQGYTILREFLISYVCQGFRIDPTDFTMRERMEECIRKDVYEWNKSVMKRGRTESIAIMDQLPLMLLKQKNEVLEIFGSVMKFRNDINHAGMRHEAVSPSVLKSELKKLVILTKKHILKDYVSKVES